MRLRLSQLNYADLRRSPATWALHYCPAFVSAGACRPELPLFVWREGTPLLRELLPEMAQLPPDTRADTTDRSMVFFLPAGIPLALCLLLTAVSRTTLPALTLPLLIPTGVFAALLGAAAVGWHREGVWQQQGQLLLLSAAPVPSAPAVRVPPGYRLYRVAISLGGDSAACQPDPCVSRQRKGHGAQRAAGGS